MPKVFGDFQAELNPPDDPAIEPDFGPPNNWSQTIDRGSNARQRGPRRGKKARK